MLKDDKAQLSSAHAGGTPQPNCGELRGWHGHLTVPERLLNISGSSDFRTTSTRSFQAEIGLNATGASGLAGSADLIYALTNNKQEQYACEVLETLEFAPDQAFVNDSIIASQRVQRFLEDSLFGRKKVYMITGLKIASGLSRSTSKETQHGPSLKVSASGAPLGIPLPVEAGPGVGVTFGRGRTVTDGPALNKTVFAYRVIRIKVK
ncbi:hypothetical protein CPLU01_15510 [Colletotrichum plurivorum]|uniref:Uncharacterized protein n=1 Tax=Colletotrichum plurivorum TaxID=2175906 RepID=A0A8H6JA61_9PEZI|nr:hypothetical protein CPLU01_15510 [Colletotrichum plurivorum]